MSLGPALPRLLLAGLPGTVVGEAVRCAAEAGAQELCAADLAEAADALASGPAELVLADIALDMAGLVALADRRTPPVPVIACGVGVDARQAVAAIHCGARDFLPLPPDAALIGAALAAFANRIPPASTGPDYAALVGRTVEEVERELILATLARQRGNRTAASSILGISVRTMRNKLKSFVEAGIIVP